MSGNKKIKDKINKVRRRMIVGRVIKYSLYSVMISIAACILLAIVSHMMPITFIYMKFVYILATCIVLGTVYVMFHIPNPMSAAKTIDAKGLQERTMTALELMESNNPYAKMEIEDTYEHLERVNPKKVICLTPSTKSLVISLGMTVLLIVTMAIPNKQVDTVKEKENMHVIKKEAKKEIEKIKKEIKEDTFLSKKDKEELEKAITELDKEISDINNEKELKKQAESNKELMEFKKNKAKEKNFNNIAKKMLENHKLKELGKTLMNKEFDKVKEEIKDLIRDASNMSDEEYQQMLNNISEQLAGLDMNQLSETLSQLAKDMELTNNQLSSSQYALTGNGNTNNSSSSGTGNPSTNTSQGSNSQSSNSSSNNGGNNSTSNSGNGSGNGNSNVNGSGSGNGRGVGSANSETDGELLNGATDDQNINGQRGNKVDSKIQIMREGISIGGEKVPYDQVIGEYESKAYESMNMTDIPKGMQEVVKEYFSGLN